LESRPPTGSAKLLKSAVKFLGLSLDPGGIAREAGPSAGKGKSLFPAGAAKTAPKKTAPEIFFPDLKTFLSPFRACHQIRQQALHLVP
jgi:hypothetical protein